MLEELFPGGMNERLMDNKCWGSGGFQTSFAACTGFQ